MARAGRASHWKSLPPEASEEPPTGRAPPEGPATGRTARLEGEPCATGLFAPKSIAWVTSLTKPPESRLLVAQDPLSGPAAFPGRGVSGVCKDEILTDSTRAADSTQKSLSPEAPEKPRRGRACHRKSRKAEERALRYRRPWRSGKHGDHKPGGPCYRVRLQPSLAPYQENTHAESQAVSQFLDFGDCTCRNKSRTRIRPGTRHDKPSRSAARHA